MCLLRFTTISAQNEIIYFTCEDVHKQLENEYLYFFYVSIPSNRVLQSYREG